MEEAYGDMGGDDENGNRKAYTFSSKTNAIKEIEEWAHGSNSGGLTHDLARSTGQLTDNVTEARMLKSKIFELSKERYKFKIQNDYEKKLFIDRQQRKTTYLKDLMKGIPLDPMSRRQSWTAGSSHGLRSNSAISTNSAPHQYISARMAYLERMDINNSADRPKEILKREEEIQKEKQEKMNSRASFTRSGSKISMPQIKNANKSKSAPSTPASKSTSTLYPTEPALERSKTSASGFEKLPDVNVTDGNGRVSFVQQPNEPAPSGGRRPHLLRQKEMERSKSKVQFAELPSKPFTPQIPRGPTHDPRFLQLQNTLGDVYKCEQPIEVSIIIQNTEALHVPPKKPKNEKPKIGLKVQEFMASRGIVF